ncbi:ABC transporter substrate-binding protein [Candidatus Caldatribacterium saccharofermentans]|uniref:ABC transporter substrate-binding protein n=1 Tax=Candidatus Caldatribacterium saccharofermentans TaxID=1454753 RepID=A0A7V4TH45_9BACT
MRSQLKLVVGILGVLFFASCAFAQVTLNFWTPFTGPDGPYMEKLVNKFNEEHQGKIQVVFQVVPGGIEFNTNLALAISSKTAPEVVAIRRVDLVRFITSMRSFTKEELSKYGIDLADFVPGPLQGVLIDDNTVCGLPLDAFCLGFYYNADHFTAAGLDPNNPPANRESFIDAAQKLTKDLNGDGTIDQWGWFSFGGYTLRYVWQWYTLLFQNRGQILTEDRKKAAFNNEAGIDALAFYVDLIHKYGVAPKEPSDPEPAFASGVLSMHFNGPWMLNLFKQQGVNFKVAPIPVLGQVPGVWGSSHILAIPAVAVEDPAKLEAAVTFVKWLSEHSMEWAAAGQIPARLSILNNPRFKEALPEQYVFSTQLPYFQSPPDIVALAEIETELISCMESAFLGQKTPAEAIAEAAAAVDEILAEQE